MAKREDYRIVTRGDKFRILKRIPTERPWPWSKTPDMWGWVTMGNGYPKGFPTKPEAEDWIDQRTTDLDPAAWEPA